MYPISGSFSLYSIVDTDGQPGAEVVVISATGTTGSGISVIHDPSRNAYYYPINTSFTVTAACNSDGQAGAELFVTTINNKYMITDRLRTMTITTNTSC